ncbi:Transposase, partial [Cordylochernes scorpioides]
MERAGDIAPLVSHISEFPVHGYCSRSGLTTPYYRAVPTCAASPARHVEVGIRVRKRKDSGLPRLWIIFLGYRKLRQTAVFNRIHLSETALRADRQILRMAVTDRSVISRTVAQQIQSVTIQPVSVRTIRRRLQQSGLYTRRPLLPPPLTQNYRCLRCQRCYERRMWTAEWNEIIFTDGSTTPRWSESSLETPWREDAEQLRYAPPHWSCTVYYGMKRYWISLSHSSSTHCWYFKPPMLHLR